MSGGKWAGRVAVITGAGSGIGRALAASFTQQGAVLILGDIDEAGLEETRRLHPAAASVELAAVDVRDPDAVERLADRTFERHGSVHLLCNNAGVGCGGRIWDQPLADWDWLFRINVMGVVHGLHSFIPRMLDQGAPAHVVNTASMMGLLTAPGLGAYAASKHAVLAISETLRHDLAAENASIGVSVLCPGPVATRVHEERTRPSRAESDSPEWTEQRSEIQALMAASMPARAVADRVVEAIDEARFYVFSHPDYVGGVESRYQEIHRRAE